MSINKLLGSSTETGNATRMEVDDRGLQVLDGILKELTIMNKYLAIMTDTQIDRKDIEHG